MCDGNAPMHEILLSVLFQHFISHVASTKAQYVQYSCDIPERHYSQTGITIPVKKKHSNGYCQEYSGILQESTT